MEQFYKSFCCHSSMWRHSLKAAMLTALLLCSNPTIRADVPVMVDAEQAQVTGEMKFDMSAATYHYVIHYPSVDPTDRPITLSALVSIPAILDKTNPAAPKPSLDGGLDGGSCYNNLVLACHCTITSNKECPTSFIQYGDQLTTDTKLLVRYAKATAEAASVPLADAAYRNIVVTADYQGYGLTKDRSHPYLCQEATARQVVDAGLYALALMRAGKFVTQEGDTLASPEQAMRQGWGTVAMGISQGGSTAMAVQRYVEENGLARALNFKGSICCDGPYDPVATLRFYLDEQTYVDDDGQQVVYHKKDIVTLPVAVALIVKGLIDCDPLMAGHTLDEYFSSTFITTGIFQWIEDKQDSKKQKTASAIARALYNLCVNGGNGLTAEDYQAVFPDYGGQLLSYHAYADAKQMLTPMAYDYFACPDSIEAVPTGTSAMADLHRALLRNTLTRGWTPAHPIYLFHSTRDTVVPFANYLSATDEFGDYCTIYSNTESTSDHVLACEEFLVSLISRPDLKALRKMLDYAEPSLPVAGDVNDDGTIDVADINLAVNGVLGKDAAFTGIADMNGDGIIDIDDVNTIINLILKK